MSAPALLRTTATLGPYWRVRAIEASWRDDRLPVLGDRIRTRPSRPLWSQGFGEVLRLAELWRIAPTAEDPISGLPVPTGTLPSVGPLEPRKSAIPAAQRANPRMARRKSAIRVAVDRRVEIWVRLHALGGWRSAREVSLACGLGTHRTDDDLRLIEAGAHGAVESRRDPVTGRVGWRARAPAVRAVVEVAGEGREDVLRGIAGAHPDGLRRSALDPRADQRLASAVRHLSALGVVELRRRGALGWRWVLTERGRAAVRELGIGEESAA